VKGTLGKHSRVLLLKNISVTFTDITRHSQKITGKVGAVDYETAGVIYPRAKL
jgi:hypothetical protein